MSKTIVIVGGVAGGMSCAARIRRLDESAEIIVFEKGGAVSFANCGMPYYVGGAGRIKAMAFDKTGTLTEGKPAVVQVSALNGHSETELLERAAAMEMHSDHPLAVAILEYSISQGVAVQAASDVRAVPGKGIRGRLDGREFWLGSHRLLEELGQETPEVHEQLELLSATGHTVVVVGNDAHVCGFFALADRIRPEAATSIRRLRSLGVDHLVMLTGDNRGTAEAIAKEAGVIEVEAELLPEEKVTAVESLVGKHQTVAMVGDEWQLKIAAPQST